MPNLLFAGSAIRRRGGSHNGILHVVFAVHAGEKFVRRDHSSSASQQQESGQRRRALHFHGRKSN